MKSFRFGVDKAADTPARTAIINNKNEAIILLPFGAEQEGKAIDLAKRLAARTGTLSPLTVERVVISMRDLVATVTDKGEVTKALDYAPNPVTQSKG